MPANLSPYRVCILSIWYRIAAHYHFYSATLEFSWISHLASLVNPPLMDYITPSNPGSLWFQCKLLPRSLWLATHWAYRNTVAWNCGFCHSQTHDVFLFPIQRQWDLKLGAKQSAGGDCQVMTRWKTAAWGKWNSVGLVCSSCLNELTYKPTSLLHSAWVI